MARRSSVRSATGEEGTTVVVDDLDALGNRLSFTVRLRLTRGALAWVGLVGGVRCLMMMMLVTIACIF